MNRGQSRFLHGAMLLAGGGGIAWGYCAYVWEPPPEPDDPLLLLEWTGAHPAVPFLRTLHLFAVPALVFAIGWIWASHVAPRLRRPWARRVTGLTLALLVVPMVVSGVALQTAASPEARRVWVWAHGVSSAVWVLAYLGHLLGRGHGPPR